MHQPTRRTLDLAKELIAFDTTSSRSNRALIDHVANFLSDHGVTPEIVPSPEEGKANLLATIGPPDAPGVIVSGHTDVVPADPEHWIGLPFAPEVRDDRLYGRGSADMKTFIAVALSVLTELEPARLSNRVLLALSFDEELGCKGAPLMMPRVRELQSGIRGCIIGEPTSMQVAVGHKGKVGLRVDVHGLEGHSAYPLKGVNAIDVAAELVARVRHMATHARVEGPFDARFSPRYTTLHTGLISGGTVLNTVPAHCSFEFEVRPLPGVDAKQYVEDLKRHFEQSLPSDLPGPADGAGMEVTFTSSYPGLVEENEAFVDWVTGLAAAEEPPTTLGFGSEAGLFSELGLPAVVCGPGSIAQAHKPDEYIELAQIAQSEAFFQRLTRSLQDGLPLPDPETDHG